MNRFIFLSCVLTMAVIFSVSASPAFGHPHFGNVMVDDHSHTPHTEIFPLTPAIGLEKTVVTFHAAEDNNLPWGFVEGKISNHVEGYPVVIQIFKNNDAVHFAQTNVDENGNYEYKFRVLNHDSDSTTNIFSGDYNVKIFKVVYLNSDSQI